MKILQIEKLQLMQASSGQTQSNITILHLQSSPTQAAKGATPKSNYFNWSYPSIVDI